MRGGIGRIGMCPNDEIDYRAVAKNYDLVVSMMACLVI